MAKENIGLDCDKVLPNTKSIKKNIYNNIIPVVDEIDFETSYSKEEIKIIKEITGEYPVLLLDDVLSELDLNRKRYILSTINGIQTIITCTGIKDIKDYIDGNAKIFNVSNGKITE